MMKQLHGWVAALALVGAQGAAFAQAFPSTEVGPFTLSAGVEQAYSFTFDDAPLGQFWLTSSSAPASELSFSLYKSGTLLDPVLDALDFQNELLVTYSPDQLVTGVTYTFKLSSTSATSVTVDSFVGMSNVTAVPEADVWVMVLAGLAVAGVAARRRVA